MSGPLIPRGRRPLGAHVTGYPALYIFDQLEESMSASIRYHHQTGRGDLAVQLGEALAQLREAARQFQEARDDTPVSGHGNAEVPARPGRAVSAGTGTPPGVVPAEVDVHDAAVSLDVTPRRARQMLTQGLLDGTKRAGRWSVNADDLNRLAADRAAIAPGTRKRADHGN